jgi:uncharacterized protein (DUF58 family)
MSPTRRAAVLALVLAASVLLVPSPLVVLALVALATLAAVDAAMASRRHPEVERTVPATVARGIPAAYAVRLTPPGSATVRQALPPDLRLEPAEAAGSFDAALVGVRRGRHELPPVWVRTTGPLGLAQRDRAATGPTEVAVYPDLPAARALATMGRQGRVGEGRRRGALGIGTDFEAVREYAPDDDVRQVNWRATARVGRPMSNQYRVDQDRDVMCLVDAGRLMGAPLGDRTRLDAALDAVTAVALVADALGDRSGAIAFDRTVRRRVEPRRGNGRAVVDALFDLEPSVLDSDYGLAFRQLRAKRSCVLVFSDLVELSAARSLLDAIPTLTARHAVIVASVRDTDLASLLTTPPDTVLDAYAAAVAVDVLDAREAVVARLRHAGAVVVEAPPQGLGSACVGAYLRLKARAVA